MRVKVAGSQTPEPTLDPQAGKLLYPCGSADKEVMQTAKKNLSIVSSFNYLSA
jgi:hypothetical protein